MKDVIIKLIAAAVGKMSEVFDEDTVIKDIEGFDSLQFVMLISELQEDYNIEIPLDKALEAETIGDLILCAK